MTESKLSIQALFRGPWAVSLPMALLGGYACGVASTAIFAASNSDASLLAALFPEPMALVAGTAAFLGLSWMLRRQVAKSALITVHEGLLTRLNARGFASGAASGRAADSDDLAEASLTLADRVIAQAYADRKEVEKYKDALSKYADSKLASQLKNETHFSNVQTKKIHMAVMFTDIRGFTTMSEKLQTEEVVYILNDYFAMAAEAVHKNNGRINKFIGDAVMAVFEEPSGYVTGSTACKNAVNAGIQLMSAYRGRMSRWREKILTPFESDLGCGIHFGPLIFGNMGSPERMEYTAIGDTVNFASRLCSKAMAGQVRISEECFKLVDGYFEMTPEEAITVKGKSGEFKTWLVSGTKGGLR